MKNLKNELFGFLLFIAALLAACKEDKEAPEPLADIYVTGYILDENYSHSVAVYWKNGTMVKVTDQTFDSFSNDIKVHDGSVYMTGDYDNKPCYWKDGQRFDLSENGLYIGTANKMQINDQMLYIAVNAKSGINPTKQALLWKINLQNNQPEIVKLSLTDSEANDLAVKGLDVLIAGSKDGNPGYWINSANNWVAYNADNGRCNSIIVIENEVYTQGYSAINNTNYWGYWNNNKQFQQIGLKKEDAYIKKIFVQNSNNIYMLGHLGGGLPPNQFASYWLNGIRTELSNKTSSAEDMAINGPYQYICGTNSTLEKSIIAGYWRNGKWQALSTAPSRAQAIYIAYQ
ncbi:MAG: hypothetical protein ACKOW2_08640 [Sphingobacteriaceae bacterium]